MIQRFIIWMLIGCASTLCAADLEWLKYEDAKEMRGMDLPVINLRSKDLAYYAALQFGPGDKDILYIVFDCKERLSHYDLAFAYIPDHPKYGRPVRLTGRRRSDGCKFPTIKLSSSYDDVIVDLDLDISVRSLWDAQKLDSDIGISCRLRDPKANSQVSFLMKGTLDAGNNSAAYIDVVRLLDKPTLKGRWDHRSDPPHVRGRIAMGKFALVPMSGMSDKARLEIFKKGDGTPKMTRQFKIDPGGAYTEFTYYPWKRMHEEREYDMKLMMDLGSFFGQVSASDTMVLR